MSNPDLEAFVTTRIRDALKAAIQRTGPKEFGRLSGIDAQVLTATLESNDAYVPLATVALACQINKSQGDTDPSRSSISECLKGAILRLPQQKTANEIGPPDRSTKRRRRADFFKSQKRAGGLYDQSSLRIVGFSVNLFTFLVLGYFLGGIVFGPLFGLAGCVGVTEVSPWLTPCAGSGIGLVFGAIVGLAYTYYYFVKKL